ncbi:MAG: hypothetical protein Q4C55_09985 [Eubacterium sp.]|nr:hypothetical protein [Eubacterium sp.]
MVSFLLLICLLALSGLLFAEMTVLNVRSYTSQLDRPETFGFLKTTVDAGMGQLAQYTNVPESALTSGYSEAELKAFASKSYETLVTYLKGESNVLEISYPSEGIYASVSKTVQDYAANSGVAYDVALEDQVQSITDMTVTAIDSYVMVMDPELLNQTGVLARVRSVFERIPSVLQCLGLVFVILMLLLWLINKRHRMRTFWWSGSALAACGMTLLIPGLIMKISGLAEQFGSRELYAFKFIQDLAEDFLTRWCLLGLVELSLGALMLVTYALWRRRQIVQAQAERAHREKRRQAQAQALFNPTAKDV